MNGLGRRIVAGIAWRSAGTAGSQVATLAFAVALARLLTPAEFGLVAMVTVVTGFVALLAQLGIGAAVVQGDDLDEDDLSTLFWTGAAAGLVATALVAAAAPGVARFYGEPSLVPLTLALSAELGITSLASVQRGLLERRLDFRSLSAADVACVLVGGSLAVGLALAGAGVWSLVARSLAASALRSAWLWRASGFRPRPRWRAASLVRVRRFCTHLLGTQALNYWTRNLDSLLVARFLGVQAVGLYNRAYALLLHPLAHGSRVVSSVLFPSLSEIRGEPQRTRSLFLRALDAVALVSFPLNLGLVAVMDLAVPVVLGAAWVPMVPLAKIFCAVGLVQSLAVLNGSLYLSQGRTDLQLRWGLLFRSVALVAIVVGLRWGVLGVAGGYALATLATWYPNTRIATGLVGLRVGGIVRRLAPVLACAGGMALGVQALGRALEPHASEPLRLLAQLAAGPPLYAGLLTLARVRAAAELVGALRRQLGRDGDEAAVIRAAAPRDTAG